MELGLELDSLILAMEPQTRKIFCQICSLSLSSSVSDYIHRCAVVAIIMEYGEGIPGDGRCLFRSVVHGAWLRAGKQSPSESLQKELADELRAKVADEFIKRRADTEWFVEGDFDNYVVQMRQPHIWGGEPELLMCSHVLQMPITVYMREKSSGILKIISEYGQEYGKENPVGVLYHGYGHYDVLRSPVSSASSKLRKRR